MFCSPHVRESKTVLDSGFHITDSGFQVLDSNLCQWNLDSGFQSQVGFRILWAVFQIPKPRIPYSTSINFLDCRIQILLHGAILFSYFRPRDVNPENSVSLKCSPMHVYPSAYVCLIYEKTNSLGLNWENKTLKTKRSICCLVYTIPIFLSFSLVHFHMGCTCF